MCKKKSYATLADEQKFKLNKELARRGGLVYCSVIWISLLAKGQRFSLVYITTREIAESCFHASEYSKKKRKKKKD